MKIPAWLWIIGIIGAIALLGSGGVVAVNVLSAAWMSSSNAQKWAAALQQAETDHSLAPGLLARIAYQESHFRQDIIDGTTSSPAGALGIMQLMPQFFHTVNRPVPYTDQDTLDQINEAADFLSQLYLHYSDWTAAVAAYNAGQGTIDKVLMGTRGLPAQTAQYIAQVSADLPQVVNPVLSA